MKRYTLLYLYGGLLAAAVLCAAGPLEAASAVANFDGGNSDTIVDAYVGMAGDGWAAAWGQATLSGAITAAVAQPGELGFSELSTGGGNYLSYSLATTAAGRGTVGRSFVSGNAGLDLTQDYTISFKLRIDEDIASPETTFTDVSAEGLDSYNIFDRYAIHTATSTLSGWEISAGPWYAQTFGSLTWVVGNGNRDNTTTRVDTGIVVQQGLVYDFQVHVRPTTKAWDVRIDDGTNVYDSTVSYPDGLGWRTNDTRNRVALNFNARGSDALDVRKFSLDAVMVTGAGSGPPPDPPETVVARFTDGNDDTTYVDAYHGIAGGGWKTPWSDVSNRAAVTTTVRSPGDLEFDEVKSGQGRYLSLSADNDGTGISNAGVVRNYKVTTDPGVDWTKPHQVQFTIRIDEDVDSETLFTDENDRYGIFDGASKTASTSETCSWIVSAFSKYAEENTVFGSEVAGQWSFYNGTHDGVWDKARNVDTDVAVHSGGVYDFTIVVNPLNQTYDATVTDVTDPENPSDPFTATNLGWRTAAMDIGGYLAFYGRSNDDGDVRAFSLDDVVITQVELIQIPGDTARNQIINDADAAVLAANWGKSVTPGDYQSGDFNGDGLVNAADAAIQIANWGSHTGAESGMAVPEPAAVVFLLGALVMLLPGRRR